MAPEIVLLGLIFDNFGPLKNLPKTNPPISDAIHPNKSEKRIIFKCKKFEKKKNIKQKKATYKVKKRFIENEYILFLKIFLIKE